METPRLARQIGELSRACDVVYINGPRVLPGAALAGIRAPVVFHSHSWLPPGATRRMCSMALHRLRAHVVTSCRYVANQWEPQPHGMTVVYNGVAPPEPARAPNSGPFTVGCIGRIAPEKGQREFVQVARLINFQRPEARFVIFGATMFASIEYEREVRAAAAGLPLEFRGWAENVYDALAEIDVLLVPSKAHEATTRVILEAAAAGVPVIAFPSGGIPEVLPPGSLAHSVEEMARLALSPAPPQLLQSHSIERYRNEILAVLRTLT